MYTGKKLICLMLAAAMCAAMLSCASGDEHARYRGGKEALQAGRYAEAAEYFGPLEDYRNSRQCLFDIYSEAMALYEAGSYGEAAEIFHALEPYCVQDAMLYARISDAWACLYDLDAQGAYAALDGMDSTQEQAAAVYAALEAWCFEDTVLIRPEFVAEELRSGRIATEISDISQDAYLDELVYVLTQNAADSVYQQYRDYCLAAFPDGFAEGSDSYFTFRIRDNTYYVCNFQALYGGIVIKIPRY